MWVDDLKVTEVGEENLILDLFWVIGYKIASAQLLLDELMKTKTPLTPEAIEIAKNLY